jgi:multiple sugar transport system permease protein
MGSTARLDRRTTRRPGFIRGLTEQTLAGMARRKMLLAYLFLLPTMLGILVFTAGPVIVSLGLSLFSWDVINPAEFVGFANYQRLATDPQVWTSFANTGKFVVLAVGLQLTLAFLLALGVQRKGMPTALRYFFRSAFFLPVLTSAASISIVLAYLFHREFGVINYYLGRVGVPPVSWLNSSEWALITIVLAYVWQQVGFTFIVFIGGLGNLPTEVLEAAEIDGAAGWRRLLYVTLPLMSPTILFAAVVGVINALQVFAEPFIMTKGGPGDASRTVVLTLYEAAFKNLELGYGSAIAMILFIVIMLVTAAQFWIGNRLVFYQ